MGIWEGGKGVVGMGHGELEGEETRGEERRVLVGVL